MLFGIISPTIQIFGTRNVEIPDFGIYNDRNINHLFAGKLSWKASDNLQLNFSTNGDPSFRTAY